MPNLIHVEVAWETDPLTRPAEADWTRLGSVDAKLLVKSLKTSRGADIRTGAVEAGSASAEISDPNGNLDPSNGRSAWGQRVVTDGVTTNTDATVTSATAVFSEFDVGKAITGPGIPASTTIASVTSATEVELSANATATASGVSLTIGTASVLPRRRVRFVVDPQADVLTWDGDVLVWGADALAWGTEEAVLWTGFLRNIPIKWRKEVQWTSITAAGIIWLLSEMSLPPSVLHVETLASGPVHCWPMTETVGQIAEDIAGLNDGTYRHVVTETARLVPFDVRPCAVMRRPNTQDPTGQAMTAQVTLGTELSVSAWWQWLGDVQTDTTQPTVIYISGHPDPRSTVSGPPVTDGDMRIVLAVLRQSATNSPDGDALKLLVVGPSGAVAEIDTAGTVLLDKRPHHLVLTVATDGEFHMYLDGAELVIDSFDESDLSGVDMAGTFAAMRSMTFGWGVTMTSGTDKNDAAVGHGTYWDRLLTDQEVADIYAAGVNAWAGDLTGARANRILDLAGVDALDRDIDTGTQTCGPTLLGGANVMEYLRKIAQTEGGPVGEDAEGRVFLRERVENSPTVAAVFSDDPAGDSGYPVAPLDPDFSLDRVINYAEVTRENGVTQSAEDATSRAKYGDKTVSLETLHSSPSYARSTAARLTIRNKDPRLVFRQVVADGIDVANSVQLETDIGDAVEVIARPPRGGDPIDQTSIVERVEHDLEGHRWFTTFGVAEHTVLPDFWWDEPGQGWDESVWVPPAA